MTFVETALTGVVQGALLTPQAPTGLGVVVLGGSSGAIDLERAGLFASRGATVIAQRWFGGPGQSPGICEIPLETFTAAIDRLTAEGCERIAYIGTSKGAEAALLVAAHDPRVEVVIALSPSSVVWANSGPGADGYEWPHRSSFTWRGAPFAFVPHTAEALLSIRRIPPIGYLDLHLGSLSTFADRLEAAAIPIERARATVVLVAGGDDALWPSLHFAEALDQRLADHGKRAILVAHPEAGHRTLLPGETKARSALNAHGGHDAADRALGQAAWTQIARLLDLAD